MRGESRSGSRSPSDFNSNRGDRAERNDKGFNDSPPSNRVYACFLPEDVNLFIFRLKRTSCKRCLRNVEPCLKYL